MSDSDDDVPPPLQSLGAQVSALRSEAGGASGRGSSEGAASLPVAEVVVPPAAAKAANSAGKGRGGALKKGFFDAKPSKPGTRRRQAAEECGSTEEIPMLRASGSAASGAKSIPEFMRIELSEEEQQLSKMKDELLKALKPNESMLGEVMGNPELLSGFDDAEVMAAVDEVAKNPSAISKYANNPKVRKFYEAMGMFVGNQLEQKGAGVAGHG